MQVYGVTRSWMVWMSIWLGRQRLYKTYSIGFITTAVISNMGFIIFTCFYINKSTIKVRLFVKFPNFFFHLIKLEFLSVWVDHLIVLLIFQWFLKSRWRPECFLFWILWEGYLQRSYVYNGLGTFHPQLTIPMYHFQKLNIC